MDAVIMHVFSGESVDPGFAVGDEIIPTVIYLCRD